MSEPVFWTTLWAIVFVFLGLAFGRRVRYSVPEVERTGLHEYQPHLLP